MSTIVHDAFLKELEDEITITWQRFGYEKDGFIHVGGHYPEMTLLKASLDPTTIWNKELLQEFPHPPTCFINLDMLARYFLQSDNEDENALLEELEAIVTHSINGSFLHRQFVLEGNHAIVQHLTCHPRLMKIPFSLKNANPVLLDEVHSMKECEDLKITQNLTIDGFTKCLANWITPTPELEHILSRNHTINEYHVTWNELTGLHFIWGLGCEWAFYPLLKDKIVNDPAIATRGRILPSQNPLIVNIRWIKIWDDVFILIDENHVLVEFLNDERSISWFILRMSEQIPDLSLKSLKKYYLVISTPQSFILIPKKYKLSGDQGESFIRRLNHLIVRDHLNTCINSFEKIRSTWLDLETTVKDAMKKEMTAFFPLELKCERVLLFNQQFPSSIADEDDVTSNVTTAPDDFLDKRALPWWFKPLPPLTSDFLSSIEVPYELHVIDRQMKIPAPLTSLLGELDITCDVLFVPFAKMSFAPFYAELMASDINIPVSSLLHFKIWVKRVKQSINKRFQLRPDEILVIPTAIRINSLTRPALHEHGPLERRLFKHAITDPPTAKRLLEAVPIKHLQ